MSEPLVSVIIPAYRCAATIGQTLDSLLAQTRPVDEILVVDDGSPEDLTAALAPYADRITLIRKPNGGAASARNLGIDRASGRFVAFLDADDYWEPTKLERQLAVFAAHPEVGLVAGNYFTQAPGTPRVVYPTGPASSFDRVLTVPNHEVLDVTARIWTTTVIVRRDVLGDHRFESSLEPAEDRDLWVRLVRERPVYLLGEPLATAVLVPGSLSRSGADRDYPNMLRVVRRYADLIGPAKLRQWEGTVYEAWAWGRLHDGRPREALELIGQRLRRQPFSLNCWRILGRCLVGVMRGV